MPEISPEVNEKLRKFFGHLLKSTGPEHDNAVASFNRLLDTNSIKYGDLRFGNGSTEASLQADLDRAQKRAEEDARLAERYSKVREAEAKVEAARAKLRKERKPPPSDSIEFTPDRIRDKLADLRLDEIDNKMLYVLGRSYSSGSRSRNNNTLADYDIPFGAVVDEAIRRYKVIDWSEKAEVGSHFKPPTVKEHLEEVFEVSKQWCYRCRDAWLVVTSDEWPEIVATYGKQPWKFSVDEIVKWKNQWKNRDAEPTQKGLTPGEKYKKLCVAVSDANTMAEALDDIERIDRHLAEKLAKLVRQEDEDLREQNEELLRENADIDPLPYLDRIRDLEEEVSKLEKKHAPAE